MLPMTFPTGNAYPLKSRGGFNDVERSSLLLRVVRYCERRVFTAFTSDDEAMLPQCLTDPDSDAWPSGSVCFTHIMCRRIRG
jgi:hypothetical protein